MSAGRVRPRGSTPVAIDYGVCGAVTATTSDSGRVYHTPDGDFPSVTTILRATDDDTWLARWRDRVGAAEAGRIQQASADRGTLVHGYLERAWNGGDISEDIANQSPEVETMTLGLLAAMSGNVTATYTQELAVWNRDMGYAGRLDFVGEWNGAPAVIEFKTSNRRKYGMAAENCSLQATAYALAHNALFGTGIETIVTLVAVVDGNVQVIEDRTENNLESLAARVGEYHRLGRHPA